ncbi:MAG: ribokinase [Beutenbergiaceae bacterium]
MDSDVPSLVVAGAINLDLTAYVQRMPDPGETVADGRLITQTGGKGANQASAAARLGASVRLIGAVGADAAGRDSLTALTSAGVDTSTVQVVSEATGTALIQVDATGENSIVVCPGANSAIDVEHLSIGARDPVLAQLEIPTPVVQRLVAMTEGFVALNLSPAMQLPADLRDRVDLFIVNEEEYTAVPELSRAPLVALTLGSRGAVLLRSGVEVARGAARAPEVVNTVGAGDSFAAALTVGLLRGDCEARALQRACAVGAAAVADPRSQPLLHTLDSYSSDAQSGT